MTFESTASFVRRWLWLFLLAGFVAALSSYAVSSQLPRVYEARAKLELLPGDVTNRATDASQVQGLTGLTRTYTEVVKTRPVLEAAIRDGNLDVNYDDLISQINVSQIPNTQMLQIIARAHDPQLAATEATLVSNAFIQQVQDMQARRFSGAEQSLRTELDQANASLAQRLSALEQLRAQPATPERDAEMTRVQIDVTQLQQNYQNTARSYSDFRLANARGQDLFTLVEPPAPAPTPVEPRTLINVTLAAFVGILLALGMAYIADRLDNRLTSPERLARQTGLQLLAAIARQPGRSDAAHLPTLVVTGKHANEANLAAEAFRLLLTNLRFLTIDAPLRTMLVTSSDTGEGKTTTAANLAIAAAQSGDSVLLVDADLRRPAVHRVFRAVNNQGLTTLLLDESLPASAMVQDTEVKGLRLVTSGPIPPNPGQLLASRQMAARFRELATLADLVVFDSPPLLAVSDSANLAGQADGVILVVDAKRTRAEQVSGAVGILQSVRAHLLGAVLNRLPADSATFSGYYGYRETKSDAAGPKATQPPAAAAEGRAVGARLGKSGEEPV